MNAKADSRLIEISNCPVCSSDRRKKIYENITDFKYKIPGHWSFVKCLDCETIYLQPWLTDPESGYPKDYSQHKTATKPQIQGTGRFGMLKGTLRKAIIKEFGYQSFGISWPTVLLGKVAMLVPRLKLSAIYDFTLFPEAIPNGKLLDIGCGNGRFLSVMEMLGWEVYGIEPDSGSRQQTNYLTEAVVYPSLQDAKFPAESFDIITMNHVFEHISDPLKLLQQCYQLIKPGGKIAICVPNWKAFSHQIFGQYWYALEPPRHLIMYEPTTLKNIVEKAEFSVDKVTSSYLRESKVSFKTSWYFQKSKYPPKMMEYLWMLVNSLHSKIDKESGEEIVLWATKA